MDKTMLLLLVITKNKDQIVEYIIFSELMKKVPCLNLYSKYSPLKRTSASQTCSRSGSCASSDCEDLLPVLFSH